MLIFKLGDHSNSHSRLRVPVVQLSDVSTRCNNHHSILIQVHVNIITLSTLKA